MDSTMAYKFRRLVQSIQDASWNRFINMLSYRAESAGMRVVKVDPKDTSATPGELGTDKTHPLRDAAIA